MMYDNHMQSRNYNYRNYDKTVRQMTFFRTIQGDGQVGINSKKTVMLQYVMLRKKGKERNRKGKKGNEMKRK